VRIRSDKRLTQTTLLNVESFWSCVQFNRELARVFRTEASMDKLALRRKILRGSLAAPVLLTVSSASAAATTSFARCLGEASSTTKSQFFVQSGDNWFRQQVQVEQLWENGQNQGYFFLDQVKNVYVNINPPYNQLPFGSYMAPGWKVSSTTTRWALVWFD